MRNTGSIPSLRDRNKAYSVLPEGAMRLPESVGNNTRCSTKGAFVDSPTVPVAFSPAKSMASKASMSWRKRGVSSFWALPGCALTSQ